MSGLLLLPLTARAQTFLDWSAYSGNVWNAGNSYQRSYALTGGNGNVVIGMSGTLSEFQTNFPAVESIASKGGFASPQNAGLSLRMNLTSNANAVTSTFTFDKPGGISGIGFWISDMDASGTSWRDRIVISGIRAAGGTTTPNLIANVPGNYNLAPGTVATKSTVGDIGNTSSNGNVYVSFTQPITSFSILYNNDTGTQADPDSQHITIHSLGAAVPEPGTLFLTLSGFAVLYRRRRR